MKRKRSISLFTALLLLLFLLASCGGQSTTTTDETTTTAPTSETDNSSTEDPVEELVPITFTAYTTHNLTNVSDWGEDPVSAAILEKTGVTLEVEYTIDNSAEKLGIMLSAGDYPDLLLSINNDTVAQYAESNALVVLDDYIDQYGKNINAVFGDKIGAMRSESDGNIYGFNREYGEMGADSLVNMQVQIALLEEFDYPQITYLSELTDLIEQYIAKYPQIEGQDTLGLMSPGSGWVFNINFNNAALRASGYQDDGNYYIDPDTLEASLGITTDSAKKYLQWVNELYRKGLFDLESFNLDMPTANEKLASGRILAISAPTWFTAEGETALRNAGMEERGYAKVPLFIDETAKENSRLHYYDPYGSWKSVITTNCADPERAFQFFDTMWSEEMQILCNWGVEGVNYTLDADGQRVMNADDLTEYSSNEFYRQNTGVLLYNYWTCGAYVTDSTGQYINPFRIPENIRAGYTSKEIEALAAYDSEAVIWRDLSPEPIASEWGYAWKLTLPTDSDGAIAEVKVEQEIRAAAVYDLVTAETEEAFEKSWNDFVKACADAGIAAREAEITEAIKTRMELWYD